MFSYNLREAKIVLLSIIIKKIKYTLVFFRFIFPYVHYFRRNVSLNSNFVNLELIQSMLYNTPKPQDTKEGLSDQDFSIYMDAHTVPFSKYPSYLPEGVLGMCTEGNAEIQIGLRKYVICANDILIFMPGILGFHL